MQAPHAIRAIKQLHQVMPKNLDFGNTAYIARRNIQKHNTHIPPFHRRIELMIINPPLGHTLPVMSVGRHHDLENIPSQSGKRRIHIRY